MLSGTGRSSWREGKELGAGRRVRLVAQAMRADAEQAHRAASRVGALEERERASDDLVLVASRCLGRVVARHRGEIRIAHLDGYCSREQVLACEHACRLAGEALDLAPNLVRIV